MVGMGCRSARDASMKPMVAFVLAGVVGGAAGFCSPWSFSHSRNTPSRSRLSSWRSRLPSWWQLPLSREEFLAYVCYYVSDHRPLWAKVKI
jgi:hypothetical protein